MRTCENEFARKILRLRILQSWRSDRVSTIAIVVPHDEARHAIVVRTDGVPVKHAALALLALALPASAAAQQQPWQQQQGPQSQQQQMQPQQGAPQQMPPSIGYRLAMQPIETCHKAMMALLQRAQTDPVIRAEQEKADQPEGDTVDQIVAFMKKSAPVSTANMVANGCPPDQYVKIGFASAEAAMALQMIEQKGPVGTLNPIARENATFLKANATRLQQIDAEADAAETTLNPQAAQGAQSAPPQSAPGGQSWTPPGGAGPQRR
jgi:hypothetical protein